MMSVPYILVAILLLGLLVSLHEFGHFISARLLGISLQEYAIGFGPKLIGWTGKKSGIRYSLRLLPLGGFCAFYTADPKNGIPADDPRCLENAPLWKRMITILMGPGMNFLLAFLVAAGFFFSTGSVIYDTCISNVEDPGPAYTAGIQAGDVITGINDYTSRGNDLNVLSDVIRDWQEGDDPLVIRVRHTDGTEASVQVTPFYDDELQRYRTGVGLAYRARTKQLPDGKLVYEYQPITFGEAISWSWSSCLDAGGMIVKALKELFTTGKGIENTTGIIGTVAIISQQVETGGWESFINLLVVISINLGIMNLLPFPGLDGSRFLFMVVEAVRRKPIPPEKENIVHSVGVLLLLALMIFLMFRDTLNLLK